MEELVKEGERIGVDMEFVVERFVKIGGAAGWEGRGGKKQVTLVMVSSLASEVLGRRERCRRLGLTAIPCCSRLALRVERMDSQSR